MNGTWIEGYSYFHDTHGGDGDDDELPTCELAKEFFANQPEQGADVQLQLLLVRWMPSSSRVLGRLVSTSPTTCDGSKTPHQLG